jgi:hypothetical protein
MIESSSKTVPVELSDDSREQEPRAPGLRPPNARPRLRWIAWDLTIGFAPLFFMLTAGG